MKTLDQISLVSDDHRTNLTDGKLKIGPDYACIYVPELPAPVLPDGDLRGYTVVGSSSGTVQYTGEIVEISAYDTADRSRTTFRCTPAESSG
ncbi:hypothetical protein GRX01_04210 [Halobaculum sp. WSA2]|uniref:Uncharacterized protein n=1 Tax=Halobaculum saliterrae TaxID=2073113 RepID=A0A6B0SV60_9EURY|nr:hypothetical protein [Halobaculum saliterrae]MXR40551.1 hypothetical protein [Halobaculum saliterrae]